MMVGFAVCGSAITAARVIAKKLSENNGWVVVVIKSLVPEAILLILQQQMAP
jgi:hypothetical protein